MSDGKDAVDLWPAVKDNWAQITGAGVVLIVLHLFVMSVMVNAAVTAHLNAQDIATDGKIISMDKISAANTAGVADNKEDITINRNNVERAFAVLMGRGDPPQ